MKKINFDEKFSRIEKFWEPRIAAEFNGQHLRLARLKGEFVWHAHPNEDELFIVLEGELTIEFRDQVEHLGSGEAIMIPRGVEHRPVAVNECRVLLIEPASTINTGDQEPGDLTRGDLQWV